MAKKLWVRDLEDGMTVDITLLVLEKELRPFKEKPQNFLQVKFRDVTGTIWGKCWEDAEEAAKSFEIGDILRVRGKCNLYRKTLQLIFQKEGFEKVTQFQLADFLKKTDLDEEIVFKNLNETFKRFRNPYLRKLLELIFSDEEFVGKFKIAPGAKVHHHNYIGGLIEHTFGVVYLCKSMAKLNPKLDRELLLAGAILHDIGKVKGYSLTTLIEVSEEGGLLGHSILGAEIAKKKISEIESFPKDLELKLLHMVLSHHGDVSEIEPRFPEAVALYYADLADSQVNEFLQIYAIEKGKGKKGIWSDFSRNLKRYLYLGEA
ncbi:MAG: 3'-5' exoribonuclease YhaM family protein [Candidatus Methanofastidiosia archaeon]